MAEDKKPEEVTPKEKVETPVEPKKPTYRDHVQEMLKKVSLGEEALPKKPVDTVGEILATKGVQAGIKGIFSGEVIKESVESEIEDVQKRDTLEQDSPKETSPSDFIEINSAQEAPDLMPVWNKARGLLRRIGKEQADGQTFVARKVEGRDDEPSIITAQLVKNPNKDNVPYMKVSFDEDDDSTPAELAIPYIKNVGISVNEDSILETETANFVYFEFDA